MATVSRMICGLAAAAFLAGCANVTPVPTDVATTGMANSELALQNSMTSVQLAMAELTGMGEAPTVVKPPIVPDPLNKPINFSWNGPVDQGVKKLADSIGYSMIVSAPKKALPLSVDVDVANVTTLDAFQAIGNAAGTSATVLVDPQHHTVEVEHHV
jgi:defect-in-organelle-trafficking protein DotD